MRTTLPPRPLPSDTYTGSIVEACLLAYDWRASHDNPEGLALRVCVELEADDGPAHIFDAVDVSNTDRIAAIFASAGLQPPASLRNSLDDLVGRPVRLTTKNLSPKLGRHAGRMKACVASWLRLVPQFDSLPIRKDSQNVA